MLTMLTMLTMRRGLTTLTTGWRGGRWGGFATWGRDVHLKNRDGEVVNNEK